MHEVRWALLAAAVTSVAMLIHKPRHPVTPILRCGLFWGISAFIAWMAIQSFWALDSEAHLYLISLYLKFTVVIFMIARCIETEEHLRWFLWAHVSGCFYLGWLAFSTYTGGRLDGVGGAGIDEANAAALQIATGVMFAGSLFLVGRVRIRIALLGMIPFMVNALVATISRSGFLSASVGGLVYLYFSPRRFRGRVWGLAALALALFMMLTNQIYWERIETIKLKGADIEGVDTGGGRLEIMEAQWRMFEAHPLGCGHWCTAFLSPSYIEQRFLSGGVARASHNTFMTMVVDHGIIGAALYVAMLGWAYRQLRMARDLLRGRDDFLASVLPAIAAALAAVTVADLFVQYPRLEVRIWLLALLPVVLHLARADQMAEPAAREPISSKRTSA
jgi:O-antigen ligase